MKDRVYTLDLFRILSVLCIFLFHSNMHLGCNYKVLTSFISQSAIFMVAFFMLSGFSLYYNYYNCNLNIPDKLKIFYIKRIIKIYPLYIFTYIAYLLFYNTLPLKQNVLIAPIELLLLQSFFDGSFSVSHNGGTWFISCLFFCYFLFPWLKAIIAEGKAKKIEAVCFFYIITLLSPIIVKVFQFSNIYSNPFFRLLEFIIGMFVADFVIKFKSPNKKHVFIFFIISLAILILSITYLKKNPVFTNDYTMYNFISVPCFAIMIYSLSNTKNKVVQQLARSLVIQYLSKISFSFFLAQFFCFNITKLKLRT